ncbi:TonB-dependent receptor [Algoriphagus zhangzhouensis]|uniref:Outer membrane receptor proteins, mostly Fe transport n=1 Tax=Algoriphagus zhangzhouensis TaxID=1073327 RepID=A0A1M7ZK08_9BACT|nr:TonB-dependent receptor [Algoriphagus zhangzhouensis]TDY43110.1 outer membrane receptor protein involved in Fe transport [Algoriphagus zhangzhouensis]SHO65221.1 Outer membrane receptor proteins, mostly Fe transport [Algoriphagus zhangzhouensis]
MRKLLPLLFYFFIQTTIIFGQTGIEKITFDQDYKDTPLSEVLLNLESKKGAQFFYKDDWGIEAFLLNGEKGQDALIGINDLLETYGYSLIEYKGLFVIVNQEGLESYQYEFWEENDINLDQYKIIGSGKPENSNLPVVVKGSIKDASEGEPLIGASIQVLDSSQGVVTDIDGNFELPLVPGKYKLMAQYAGYEAQSIPVQVINEGELEVELFNQTLKLEEVTISARSQEITVSEKIAGREILDIAVIKSLPTFMGEVDPVKSLISLPGVSSVGEGTAGFNVRGGDPGQNLLMMDEAIIYNSSHLFGFFGAFSPDMIRDVELYKGGGPANYGGRVSSVLNVNLRNGNAKEYEVAGGIGLISSRLSLEGPLNKDKTSFILSGRTSYPNWMLKQMKDPDLYQSAAGFYDVNLKVNHTIDENNVLTFSGYLSDDNFEFASDTAYVWKTKAAIAKWSHRFNSNFLMQTNFVVSDYKSNIENNQENFGFDYTSGIKNYQGKIDFSYSIGAAHKLDFGISSLHYSFDNGTFEPGVQNSNAEAIYIPQESALESAVYFNDEFSISPKVSLVYGLRVSNYLTLGGTYYEFDPNSPKSPSSIIDTLTYQNGEVAKTNFGIEPRVSFRWLITPSSSFKASYYRTNQYIHLISNTAAISPVNYWKSSGYNLDPSISDQYTLGLFKNWNDNLFEISVEGYYKWIQNVVDYKNAATILLNETLDADLVQGKGKAYGVEFMLRKNRGKLTGWLGYTYSRSLRQFNESPFDEEIINEGVFFPSNYDKPHDVSVVMNYKFSRRFSMNMNFAYSTGRPITVPVSKFQYEDFLSILNYSDRNQYRVPDYHRMDLAFTLKSGLKKDKKVDGEWVFSVYNVYSRRNPFSVYFTQRGNAFQLSVLGSAFPSISYNFKL